MEASDLRDAARHARSRVSALLKSIADAREACDDAIEELAELVTEIEQPQFDLALALGDVKFRAEAADAHLQDEGDQLGDLLPDLGSEIQAHAAPARGSLDRVAQAYRTVVSALEDARGDVGALRERGLQAFQVLDSSAGQVHLSLAEATSETHRVLAQVLGASAKAFHDEIQPAAVGAHTVLLDECTARLDDKRAAWTVALLDARSLIENAFAAAQAEAAEAVAQAVAECERMITDAQRETEALVVNLSGTLLAFAGAVGFTRGTVGQDGPVEAVQQAAREARRTLEVLERLDADWLDAGFGP